jgi:phosphatidylserine/phosphatidylglycerophosphate/cardiolipin synthase-like enzyme
MSAALALALLTSCALLWSAAASDNCYDHQTETYSARFSPAGCTKTCTVTPFFSPDTSITTYVSLIEEAQESIDIYTPGLRSWSYCTNYKEECQGCTGCSIEAQRNESFPVFPALLNAVHERGIKIRIITNNFTIPACPGKITPFDWLVLNDVQVRMYTTTTFQHAKYITVDKGKKTAVSSVNWSYTSFLRNREAGVILEDCTCSAVSLYQSVFDYDWDNGEDYVITQTYTPSEMAVITNKAHMPYTVPDIPGIPGAFMTQLIKHESVAIKKGYSSPDSSRDTIMSYFPQVQQSFNLAVYQVTDDGLCDELLSLYNRGVNVTVMVSDYIVSEYDYYKAQDCYKKLYDGGMKGRVQYAYSKFEFSHEKYWIIDSTTVHLSTGNWSPSDFPTGTSWKPYSESGESVNRDLQIVLEQQDMVDYFFRVYDADWALGKAWEPKSLAHKGH